MLLSQKLPLKSPSYHSANCRCLMSQCAVPPYHLLSAVAVLPTVLTHYMYTYSVFTSRYHKIRRYILAISCCIWGREKLKHLVKILFPWQQYITINFIYRSIFAAYFTSDQHRFEFFLQISLLHNKCVFDLLYCQNMPTSAHIDSSVLRCMTSFTWKHNWNIFFLNLLRCLAYLNKNVQIFRAKKFIGTPSVGGEVKPSFPCRRCSACKRYVNLCGSGNWRKITG